jgi:hypothetical protein
MTAATLEESNTALRDAVTTRLAASMPSPVELFGSACCDGGKCQPRQDEEPMRLVGDSLLQESSVHPASQRFFDCLDALREMHISKSAGYGAPDGTDPLANIRNGAKFVGISPWKAAMVRFSDKVTRIHTYLMTGSLSHESLSDNLLDAASYAVLAKLLYEEEHGA